MSYSLSLKPDPCAGLPSQDAGAWYTKFQAWLALNEWADKPAKVANGMRLLLLPQPVPGSMSWSPQCHQISRNWDSAFRDRFIPKSTCLGTGAATLGRTMQPTEGLDAYITAIDSLCARLQKPDVDRITSFCTGSNSIPSTLNS